MAVVNLPLETAYTPLEAQVPAMSLEIVPAEAVTRNWGERLRNLPRSMNRVAFASGALALGVEGPEVTQEMARAFHENVITRGSTAALFAAAGAGTIYAFESARNRFSKPRVE